MHSALENIQTIGEQAAKEVEPSEQLGRVSDAGIKLLVDAGIMRMLQPKDFGGDEGDPREFLEILMELGHRAPSVAWVAGVVGVHPFEFAQCDRRVQEEVWGEDRDTLIASPYAFIGRAKRVDGGYVLNGQWPFSSGTDHCKWVVLAGLAEKEGGPADEFTELTHFILPRADYEILQDTWKVMGLLGTGSKDVRVTNAFVPDYRVLSYNRLTAREYATQNRPGNALYQLPFELIFPGAIAATSIGIAQGVVNRIADYTRDRVSRMGIKSTQNPWLMADLGAALADIDACRLQVLNDITEAYDFVKRGGYITPAMQAKARVHQVRAVHRVTSAASQLFKHAGGNSSRLSNPIQRQWRDLSVALGHACNVEDPVYAAYAGMQFGIPAPKGVII